MDTSKISINSVQTKKIKPEYLYHVSMDIEPDKKSSFLEYQNIDVKEKIILLKGYVLAQL